MDFIKMFNAIDEDNSGEITVLELEKFMKKNNMSEVFVDKWLELFDKRHCGYITISEFCDTLGLEIDENMRKTIQSRRESILNFDEVDKIKEIDKPKPDQKPKRPDNISISPHQPHNDQLYSPFTKFSSFFNNLFGVSPNSTTHSPITTQSPVTSKSHKNFFFNPKASPDIESPLTTTKINTLHSAPKQVFKSRTLDHQNYETSKTIPKRARNISSSTQPITPPKSQTISHFLPSNLVKSDSLKSLDLSHSLSSAFENVKHDFLNFFHLTKSQDNLSQDLDGKSMGNQLQVIDSSLVEDMLADITEYLIDSWERTAPRGDEDKINEWVARLKKYLDGKYQYPWHVIVSADEYAAHFTHRHQFRLVIHYQNLAFNIWRT